MPSFFRCAAATMPLTPAPMTAALFGVDAMPECCKVLTLSTAWSHLEASVLPTIRFRRLAQELQAMPYVHAHAHAHVHFKIHNCICKHHNVRGRHSDEAKEVGKAEFVKEMAPPTANGRKPQYRPHGMC
jgi:hypothetical protein